MGESTVAQVQRPEAAIKGTQAAELSKQTNQNGTPNSKKDKSKKKQRRKKKAQRIDLSTNGDFNKPKDEDLDVIIEYVPETLLLDDENLEQFSKVFEHFNAVGVDEEDNNNDDDQMAQSENEAQDSDKSDNDSDEGSEDGDNNEMTSKKKLKMLSRMSVAELKQSAKKPEVVEWVDVTAQDPKLLVTLKSIRNSVPVPQHWSQKRKYLQNKRGIEKPPFKLPDFIRDTGIMEMREAVKEKEDAQTAKARMRERVQPKMNKLTIDYERLHAAFFRFQKPPANLSKHGEIYYEGKELETDIKHAQPGTISEELREALNMPPLAPPPWLTGMQRHGIPPSYPHLIIPGLNAPIPPGAQWGFHPGGWGRPPLNEHGQSLYGDVFGVTGQQQEALNVHLKNQEVFNSKPWGELESDEEESESESEEESDADAGAESGAEDMEEDGQDQDQNEDNLPDGLETPSGSQSLPPGLKTPASIQLRKNVVEEKKQLYHVLPQVEARNQGFMGSQHVYDLSGAQLGKEPSTSSKSKGDGVTLSVDPSELDSLDSEAIKAKYKEQLDTQNKNPSGGAVYSEDMSDMVAEHAEKQERKRKQQQSQQSTGGSSGKAKKSRGDFKF